MIKPLFLALLALVPLAAQTDSSVLGKLGHSSHGEAFDVGPREKPWVIEGIGEAHLPITTNNPEVQKWFDQGNALLHSFWDYEAERAFRWCLKLEPDNAMAYWGLARASQLRGLGGNQRPADMIREALKRKDKVSPREQLYIDAFAAQVLPDPISGAHHYRIHNWDYHEPEQALESARRYGDIVPGIGHALHMPGHIFSIVGMWNEAAISMDAATRREKQYMQQRLTFPFNNWNYGHNRNYLSYIQEQMGMVDAAIFGARQLIDAPLDPEGNADSPNSSHSYGIASLARALLKFERWDDLLKENNIPWRGILLDKVNRAYFEARAWLAKSDLDKTEKSMAAHTALKANVEKDKSWPLAARGESRSLTVAAL